MLTDEQWKQIEENINNMSDEEFAEKFLVDENSTNSPWHPSKQNSFYSCWYCGNNGNAHLCTDGMGRGFCPECRERAEKEFLGLGKSKTEGGRSGKMREGEPCNHRGCLSHISHPCESCGRVGGRYVLESAIESYKYGLHITYDGDKHKIMFGGKCSHCGEWFESERISLYCKKCNRKERWI